MGLCLSFRRLHRIHRKENLKKVAFNNLQSNKMGLFSTIKPSNPSPKEAPKPIPPPVQEKPPEKPVSDSMFGGRSYATQRQRIQWMKDHRDDIWRNTKHRVGKKDISGYEKNLFNKKYGPITEKSKREPQKIEREMQKNLRRTGGFQKRQEIKQNMGIIGRMFGSGKRPNN